MTSTRELLGSPLADGDPETVRSLGRSLRQTAGSAAAINTSLKRVDSGQAWQGDAATLFSDALDDLPRDLAKIHDSCLAAGDATIAFADALGTVRSAVGAQVGPIQAADGAITSANARIASVDAELRRLAISSLGHLDPAAQVQIDAQRRRLVQARALASASQARAKGELDAAHRAVEVAKDAFRDAERRCKSALEAASDLGIKNSIRSFVDRHGPLGVVVKALQEVTKILINGTIGVVWNLGVGLLSGDWAPFSKSLDDLGLIAAAAALVLIAVGTGGTALVVLAGIGAAAAGTKLATDALRRNAGDERVADGDLAGDVASVGLSLIPGGRVLRPAGKALGHGVDAGRAFLGGASRQSVGGFKAAATKEAHLATRNLRSGWTESMTEGWVQGSLESRLDDLAETGLGVVVPEVIGADVDAYAELRGTAPVAPTPFTTTPNAQVRYHGTFGASGPDPSPYRTMEDLFFLDPPAGSSAPSPTPGRSGGGAPIPSGAGAFSR
ncbi:hypothetical protein AB0L40_22270 [Patulibacter sp. NPDC049589]|uniref:WXG100 family type VII secretion target n=1 Tax=Patulibacter sp. NPDC049589 TaxID=3154731 RepID=UPI00342981B6